MRRGAAFAEILDEKLADFSIEEPKSAARAGFRPAPVLGFFYFPSQTDGSARPHASTTARGALSDFEGQPDPARVHPQRARVEAHLLGGVDGERLHAAVGGTRRGRRARRR